MSRLCWLGFGAGKAGGSVGDGAGVGAPGGAQSDAAAVSAATVSVDVPWLMFHYVDVTINGENYFVNNKYALSGFIVRRKGGEGKGERFGSPFQGLGIYGGRFPRPLAWAGIEAHLWRVRW